MSPRALKTRGSVRPRIREYRPGRTYARSGKLLEAARVGVIVDLPDMDTSQQCVEGQQSPTGWPRTACHPTSTRRPLVAPVAHAVAATSDFAQRCCEAGRPDAEHRSSHYTSFRLFGLPYGPGRPQTVVNYSEAGIVGRRVAAGESVKAGRKLMDAVVTREAGRTIIWEAPGPRARGERRALLATSHMELVPR
jgi:hypothetical protein